MSPPLCWKKLEIKDHARDSNFRIIPSGFNIPNISLTAVALPWEAGKSCIVRIHQKAAFGSSNRAYLDWRRLYPQTHPF